MLFRIVMFLIAIISSYGAAYILEQSVNAYNFVSFLWCCVGLCLGLAFAAVGNPDRKSK